jgi:hypothetical protein
MGLILLSLADLVRPIVTFSGSRYAKRRAVQQLVGWLNGKLRLSVSCTILQTLCLLVCNGFASRRHWRIRKHLFPLMTSLKCQTGAAPQFRQPVLREVVRRTTLHYPASDSGSRNAPQRPAVGAAPRTCRRHCRPAQPTTRDLERRRSVVVPCRATASGSRERSWPGRRGFPPSSAARLVISARRPPCSFSFSFSFSFGLVLRRPRT